GRGGAARRQRAHRGSDQCSRCDKCRESDGRAAPGRSRCSTEMTDQSLLIDSHGRVMRDLRVSVTDRCNCRCMYCLPETEAAENFYRERWATAVNPIPIARQWQPRQNILTFEEIERVFLLNATPTTE